MNAIYEVNCIDIIDFLLISVHHKTYILLLYSIGNSFCCCLYWSPRFGNCFLLYKQKSMFFLLIIDIIDNMNIIDFIHLSIISIKIYLYKNYRYLKISKPLRVFLFTLTVLPVVTLTPTASSLSESLSISRFG